MKTVEDYLRHAEECETLAAKAASLEQRAMIDNMAATWRLLARQRQKYILKPLDTETTPAPAESSPATG